VEYFKTNIEGISKSTLRVCWEMGYETNLIKEAAVYGEKTIENFAEQLELPDMNVKRLYRYAQFAKEYSRKELDSAMDKKHIGWGIINKLISVKDKEDRIDFENKIAEESIRPSELEQELSEYMNRLNPPEDGGGNTAPTEGTEEHSEARRSYTNNCKKITATLEIIKNTIPLAAKDMTDLNEIAGNEEKYSKALDIVFSLREVSEEVLPSLRALHKQATGIA